MCHRPLQRAQDAVEFPSEIIGEELQNEIVVLLQEGILALVAALMPSISEVLTAIERDHELPFLL